jgi:hypothetical protein
MSAAQNNKFPDCPALMSDGRGFTDYRPRCLAGRTCLGGGVSAFDMRMYLTRNGSQILDLERQDAMKRMGCFGGCIKEQLVALPEQSMQGCDKRVCTFGTYEPDGLGTGRDYFRSRNAGAYLDLESPMAPAAAYDRAGVTGCLPHEDVKAAPRYIQSGRY